MKAKILIVDDDESIRRLLRLNLTDLYEVVETGKPEEGLAMAMEHQPDAILLDLRMPGYSGFELCKTFTSFGATMQTPVFVISGEGGAKTKEYCRELGAAAYLEKPVNFEALRASLAGVLLGRRTERRKEVRVNLQVPLKLTGSDARGKAFSLSSTTENVSTGGFLCACAVELRVAAIVEVEMVAPELERVGKAQVVRAEMSSTGEPRYEFKFTEMTGEWVLQ